MNNIAFYIGDFTRSGGTERTSMAVANGLASIGKYNIYLFVTNSKEEKPFFEIDKKVSIVYLDVKNVKIGFLGLQRRIYNSLKLYNISSLIAVEVFSLFFLILPILFRGKKKVNLITWEHFNFAVDAGHRLRKLARNLAVRFSISIVVLTEKDKEMWCEANRKIKACPIYVIGNPSPFEIIKDDYNINSKKVIAIGRLTDQKGFDLLIAIWKKFVTQYPEFRNEGWHLDIIGSGGDYECLNSFILNNNLQDTIFLKGSTDKIQEYYKHASFLAMTSRYEGLPMTLLEAQSFGLPIIAYDCLTGPSDIISDKSGVLVNMFDDERFVEGLKYLVEHKELRISMSREALKEIEDYSLSNIVEKWCSTLNNLNN